MENTEFKEYTRCAQDKSSVWHYFLRSSDGLNAQCKNCKKILKSLGSTTTLHNHLKSVHSVQLNKKKTQPNNALSVYSNNDSSPSTSSTDPGSTSEPVKKKSKIGDYFPSEDDLPSMVSKLTALDGLSFKVIASSEVIRKLFKKSGYNNLPNSSKNVKKLVVQKSNQVKDDLKKQLQDMKKNGNKFSTSLDEWTSIRNRRYMNVNIHSPLLKDKGFRNLGLSRIEGRGTAENCYNTLRKKLADFGISLEEDVACVVTDGASVMTALGRRTSAYHQLCIAHGIQCGVLDVLYKNNENGEVGRSNSDSESEDGEDSEDSEFVMQTRNSLNNEIPIVKYKDLIAKIRQTVKFFKKSPTKTDLLNVYLSQNGHKKQLILDCKTRWSSMADMVTRFLELKDDVMKALIDLKKDITFSAVEIQILNDLSESLNIVKATVEALCEQKANLLTCETALKFMITKLTERNSTITRELAEAMKTRILQRRSSDLTGTLKYLHNHLKYYQEQFSDTFHNPSNEAILKTIVHINRTYFNTQHNSDVDEDNVTLIELQQRERMLQNSLANKSIQEQLRQQIDDTLISEATSSTSSLSRQDLEIAIRVEMASYDSGGPKNLHLMRAYNFLLTIPPTSVESERVFSSCRLTCSYLRSSLNDDTLDRLSFLRSYYQGTR